MNKTEDFIRKAKKKHGDTYDYSKVIYIKSSQKVTIVCPKHGDFLQTPNNHLRGKGCKRCGCEASAKTRKMSLTDFIDKAKIVHDNKYDYSKVTEYKDGRKKITIICPMHGEFQQSPADHLAGCGCPECGRSNRSKKQALKQEDFINRCLEIHGNFYNYDDVKYVNAKTDVEFYCDIISYYYLTFR